MSRQNSMITTSGMSQRPPMPPRETNSLSQHDELIKYIHEAWHKVTTEQSPVFHKSGTDVRLNGFVPFDLESWWGRRMVQNMHVSRGHGGHQ